MDIFAAYAIANWHSRSVAKSGYCAITRDWGKLKKCHQFSCLKKKTIASAVNLLIYNNSSHRIFHNSASESVSTFRKKTFRWVSINEEMTTQERKSQLLIWSEFCQSDLIWFGPIWSDPIWSGPDLTQEAQEAKIWKMCQKDAICIETFNLIGLFWTNHTIT